VDIRGFLGDDMVPAGFERVAFTTRVVSSEPAERIWTLRQTVERQWPVLDILQRPIEVNGTLRQESPAVGSCRWRRERPTGPGRLSLLRHRSPAGPTGNPAGTGVSSDRSG
jgi:hypothetical protein